MGGYQPDMTNSVLDHLNQIAGKQHTQLLVTHHNVLDQTVKVHYPNLQIKFDANLQHVLNCNKFYNYTEHPPVNFKNFICSFNGTPHVSRKLLVSILEKFGYFSTEYCSKNFSYSTDILDGHLLDYTGNDTRVYRKFFISDDSEEFFKSINSFGHVAYKHDKNIHNLDQRLTESFLHIVSETLATSYYPFVTEKSLYSVVTRGLFLAYAQPGWHAHLEKYYGFKLYTNLFDYQFDSIQNPVTRLVELMCMISKFSMLSVHDWHDLYLLEQAAIEYNYDHYFSGGYLEHLKIYEN